MPAYPASAQRKTEKEDKMETKVLGRSRFSPIILYSILAWTICFIGTWFIILKYGILLKGLIAIVVTFLFAAIIWIIPFAGLVLFYLYVTPVERKQNKGKDTGSSVSPTSLYIRRT